MSSFFLGIDSGTQSTKAIVLDFETGGIVASAHRKYDLIGGLPPGHLEQHPADWIKAVDESVGECLAQLGTDKAKISGIGVSGQQHGLVVLDAKDEVVRPAKLWCDTSTTAQCAKITKALGGEKEVIDQVGNSMRPGYTAPKILWLRQNEPENWKK